MPRSRSRYPDPHQFHKPLPQLVAFAELSRQFRDSILEYLGDGAEQLPLKHEFVGSKTFVSLTLGEQMRNGKSKQLPLGRRFQGRFLASKRRIRKTPLECHGMTPASAASR